MKEETGTEKDEDVIVSINNTETLHNEPLALLGGFSFAYILQIFNLFQREYIFPIILVALILVLVFTPKNNSRKWKVAKKHLIEVTNEKET